jgi:hypothetical protein
MGLEPVEGVDHHIVATLLAAAEALDGVLDPLEFSSDDFLGNVSHPKSAN